MTSMRQGLNKSMQAQNPFRVGIIGGMGPMAGVLLQRLIVEATPAEKDQDHLQVVCFTMPQVPDRTESLKADGGRGYLRMIQETAVLLERAGATVMVIACNTAYARIDDIQTATRVPILNLIKLGVADIAAQRSGTTKVGILATDGTLAADLYQAQLAAHGLSFLLPRPAEQQRLMDVIYRIKGGGDVSIVSDLRTTVGELADRGADMVLLGCTELSLYYENLLGNTLMIADPLRVVARQLVALAARPEVFLSSHRRHPAKSL